MDWLTKLAFPCVFEEHWTIKYIDLVHHRDEEPLNFKNQLSVDLNHLLVAEVLEFHALQIYNHYDLVYPLFVHEFLAVWELDSPCML